jgi:uncharacterized integral membrane protein
MVYCSRCGTQNPDINQNCTNCGAPLYTVGQNYPGSDREHYRKMENECFGLPNGGMIVAIIIGIIIILFGLNFLLQNTYGVSIDLWPLIIIIFGVLIVLGALYSKRRYSQRPATTP